MYILHTAYVTGPERSPLARCLQVLLYEQRYTSAALELIFKT